MRSADGVSTPTGTPCAAARRRSWRSACAYPAFTSVWTSGSESRWLRRRSLRAIQEVLARSAVALLGSSLAGVSFSPSRQGIGGRSPQPRSPRVGRDAVEATAQRGVRGAVARVGPCPRRKRRGRTYARTAERSRPAADTRDQFRRDRRSYRILCGIARMPHHPIQRRWQRK